MIDCTPEIVGDPVDLHEDLVQVPLPLSASPHRLHPLALDLGGVRGAEPVPPETHSLVAYLDATLAQKIPDIPERQREPDLEHHCQADDLRAGREVPKGGAFGHSEG